MSSESSASDDDDDSSPSPATQRFPVLDGVVAASSSDASEASSDDDDDNDDLDDEALPGLGEPAAGMAKPFPAKLSVTSAISSASSLDRRPQGSLHSAPRDSTVGEASAASPSEHRQSSALSRQSSSAASSATSSPDSPDQSRPSGLSVDAGQAFAGLAGIHHASVSSSGTRGLSGDAGQVSVGLAEIQHASVSSSGTRGSRQSSGRISASGAPFPSIHETEQHVRSSIEELPTELHGPPRNSPRDSVRSSCQRSLVEGTATNDEPESEIVEEPSFERCLSTESAQSTQGRRSSDAKRHDGAVWQPLPLQSTTDDAIRKKRAEEEEARLLREQEAHIWAALAPTDAQKVKGMLQAVALYQQHLEQNEFKINDLHTHVEKKDRDHRTLRRRVQQAKHGTSLAEEEAAGMENEYDHWSRATERCKSTGVAYNTLQERRFNLQADLGRLTAEAKPAKERLLDLRANLKVSSALCEERKAQLVETQAAQEESIRSLKDELAEQARANYAAEVLRLQEELSDAQLRARCLAKERADMLEDLQAQQREGSRLHQQSADAREEVLEMAAKVRAYLEEPLVASQLGVSLDGNMASMSFLPLPGDDPYLDEELDAVRRQCKALERECQRTWDALEKKQALCQRLRARYVEKQQHGRARNGDAVAEEEVSTPMPFVLGPEPGTAESEIITTPRFVL